MLGKASSTARAVAPQGSLKWRENSGKGTSTRNRDQIGHVLLQTDSLQKRHEFINKVSPRRLKERGVIAAGNANPLLVSGLSAREQLREILGRRQRIMHTGDDKRRHRQERRIECVVIRFAAQIAPATLFSHTAIGCPSARTVWRAASVAWD